MLHDVPLIPQQTNMSCWAASVAMILSWKQRSSISEKDIVRIPGGTDYSPSLATGLDPNDVHFLSASGFDVEPPTCYSQVRIRRLLENFGPLWIATAVPSPHIRVVCGLQGTTLSINDPAPVGVGARYQRRFSAFFGQMEHLGAQELGQPSPIYVAHLRAYTGLQST